MRALLGAFVVLAACGGRVDRDHVSQPSPTAGVPGPNSASPAPPVAGSADGLPSAPLEASPACADIAPIGPTQIALRLPTFGGKRFLDSLRVLPHGDGVEIVATVRNTALGFEVRAVHLDSSSWSLGAESWADLRVDGLAPLDSDGSSFGLLYRRGPDLFFRTVSRLDAPSDEVAVGRDDRATPHQPASLTATRFGWMAEWIDADPEVTHVAQAVHPGTGVTGPMFRSGDPSARTRYPNGLALLDIGFGDVGVEFSTDGSRTAEISFPDADSGAGGQLAPSPWSDAEVVLERQTRVAPFGRRLARVRDDGSVVDDQSIAPTADPAYPNALLAKAPWLIVVDEADSDGIDTLTFQRFDRHLRPVGAKARLPLAGTAVTKALAVVGSDVVVAWVEPEGGGWSVDVAVLCVP